MLTEPSIDKSFIQKIIADSYGLEIINFTFLKGGEASWGYKVDTANGETFFCKIHTGLTDHEKRFELTYRLFNECGIKNITHPIKTLAGDLVVYVDKYPTALFNFIDGSNSFDQPLNKTQEITAGELLGKIHQAKNKIGSFAIQEDFKYGNLDRLLNILKQAESFLEDNSKYKVKTAKLLLENQEKIQKRIQELTDLGDRLRNQNLDFVICHGEPHRWNTMVDENGEVYLIDWDDSLFAPKEKDLNMIKDQPNKLAGYAKVTGSADLNPEIVHYYNMEWNISEIDAWSNSLLYEESNDVQNDHFLEHFIQDLDGMDDC